MQTKQTTQDMGKHVRGVLGNEVLKIRDTITLSYGSSELLVVTRSELLHEKITLQ